MLTQAAFALVDSLAEEAKRAGIALADDPLCTQAAFVRSLVDEVEHRHPSDHWIAPLHHQLAEEIARLEQMVLVRSKEGSDGAGRAAAEMARPVDVLAVDDDRSGLRAVATMLREWGYRWRTASSAEEALEADRDSPADIVLSDWSMPGMNGLELCAALKRREQPPYVILVTAFADQASLLEGARGKADAFLAKPIDLAELEARLSAASRLVRALRSVVALNQRLRSSPPPPASSDTGD
jgi:CheY-like chemotaxis protein